MAGTDTGMTEQSGAELAAAALLSLGETVAASVLRHMDERSIGVISDAMARSRSLDSAAATSAMARLATDLQTRGPIPPDGFGFLRRLLVSAFGEDKAGDMMERIMRSSGGPIDVLSHTDPRMLAEQLALERPQLLAVLLGHMNRLTAVSFLGSLPEARASEVVYRFARMDAVQPAAMAELRAMLSEALGGQIEARTTTIGGIRNAAELLNGMGGSASEKALAQIRTLDADLADRLRENMFTFEDLLNLGDQALQAILRVVPSEQLGPALRAAPAAVRTRILDNVSKKAADYLRDEIENGPMVTRAEAHAAQRTIVEAALSLAREGKLSLQGDEDML